jgi:hypothetical protein
MSPTRAGLAILIAASTACHSPAEPDPRIPPPVGTPTSMLMQPCEYAAKTTRCPVDAFWGDLYRSTRAVTTLGEWTSDTPSVVRIVDHHTLQSAAPGTAFVSIDYSGRRLTTKFRVLADGPPWRVFSGEFHVKVRDVSGQPIEGALVEITAGADAGLSATSDRFGEAVFVGETTCGPITARATKAGFHTWTGSATNCGRAGNGNWGSETLGPVVLTPS